MPENHLSGHLRKHHRQLEQQGLLRAMMPTVAGDKSTIEVEGQQYLNLAGNDYLGLAGDRQLVQEFYQDMGPDNLLGRFGPGSGASRLMTGNHTGYQRLEEQLSNLYKTESALVFNSGYHINIGLLPALAGKGDLILADKLCHASLIDGMRLSRARVIRYPHCGYDQVKKLLQRHSSFHEKIFLVTESLFSMDGDCADLDKLVNLKEQYGAILYVDEAHAVGVRGPGGLGLAEEQNVLRKIDLLVGTFGKAWAGQGAFVACSQLLADNFVNSARSLIFTTAMPPVAVNWLSFVAPRISAMSAQRDHLRQLANELRTSLQAMGLTTGGSSQIVPVMIGDAARAVTVADKVRQQGFWINAIRPPTVPPGTSRLRLSLTAGMDADQLASLPDAIAWAMA